MTYKIQGEQPFQVLATNFSIGPSNEGYTLQVSADGNDYSDLFTVAANTTRMVTDVANGSYYRLSGNNSDVSVNWRSQCTDGKSGGGSGSGSQGPMGPQGFQGPAGGGGDTGQVQTMIETAINNFSDELQDGEPIVGMAKQLYSPDGVTSEGGFTYRTTAGDQDVTSGPAELRKLGGEGLPSIWNSPEIMDTYTPSVDEEEVQTEISNEYLLALKLGNEAGTYEFEYNGSEWVPELPDEIEIVDGTPVSGASLSIEIIEPMSWTPIDAQPDEFISTGLNNFDPNLGNYISILIAEDKYFDTQELITSAGYNTYVFRAVPDLENGYIIMGSGVTLPRLVEQAEDPEQTSVGEIADELGEGHYVAYPTSEFPFIMFSVPSEYIDTVCIHPRWSGIKDDVYEPYSESRIDLSSLPRLYKIIDGEGEYDYIDFVNGKIVRWVDIQEYDADVIIQLEEDGDIYECDGEYIYTLKDEPDIDDIPNDFDYHYTANDFGVEYYVKDGELLPYISDYDILTETWYMQNLVDKLRRMKSDYIHLDTLIVGEQGKTYEYEGRLMKWNNGAGYTAEWLKPIGSTGEEEGTGLIFATIPDGQKLFELKYQYGGEWRYVVYSGGTLYLTETAGTVVCAVTIGNSFTFEATQYGGSRRVIGTYENGYIGFKRTSSTIVQNVWNGSVNGGHYELIDKYNKPYVCSDTDTGVARWNQYGQVVKKETDIVEKQIYFNYTGGTNFAYALRALTAGNGGNFPTRMWAPVEAGTTGQVLTSTGGNAPVWASMIKSVKISSTDYDALVQAGTTDPNTLYLIVDD